MKIAEHCCLYSISPVFLQYVKLLYSCMLVLILIHF